MKNPNESRMGLILTILSLTLISTNTLVSIVVFSAILSHSCQRYATARKRVALMLSANIYLLIFALMLIFLSINLQTILGDLYGLNFNSSLCRFQGYFLSVLGSSLYSSFVVQVNALFVSLLCHSQSLT